MISVKGFVLAAFTVVASAAPTCKPPTTPALPRVGGPSELPLPAASLSLKKIAIGHGIQNYTCADTSGDASATGAVAVLYDATALHPDTGGKSSLSRDAWDALPATVLWQTPVPLNRLEGTAFGADPTNPFPSPPADLQLPGLPAIKFLGHHYFDSTSTPMFDLVPAGLRASVVKLDGVGAPDRADRGPMGTGAVQWLRLGDSGLGLSDGVTIVYRVVTAGGVALPCSVTGPVVQSVPYATYYWFYG